MDACQIEKYDYATEYVDNTGATTADRVDFAVADRFMGIMQYQPGSTPTYLSYYANFVGLYPSDHANYPNLQVQPIFSLSGGRINLLHVNAGTHIMYRTKAIPRKLTGASGETIQLPDPWMWVLVQGAKAYVLSYMYDMGMNSDAVNAEKVFEEQIEEMILMTDPAPGYTYISNPYARMVR